MGSACGTSENMTINDNEQHFNNDQGNARKNVIKKNEPVKKPVTTKEQEKYKDMEEYDNDVYTGESIKRMKAYKCALPYDELQKYRNDFWGKDCFMLATRKENKRIWQIIRSCCETDGETAYQILISSGLYCLDNCLRSIVDGNGNVYFVPNFLINDPVYIKDFEKEKKEKIKEEKYDIILVDVFNNKEYKEAVLNTNTGKDLQSLFGRLTNQEMSQVKVRLIYKGHEIQANHYLYQHNIDPLFPKILVSIRKLENDEMD